jgi:hypothetical protein
MGSETSVGRKVGVLLLLQMASALILPFVLMDGLVKGYPSYLETAASSASRIRAGVAVSFFGAALTLAIGIWMFSVLGHYGKRAAIWFLAVCAISCALDAVHNASVLSMLSVSERFTETDVADAIYQAWGAAAASARRSAHIVQLVAIGIWMMSFYVLLWRSKLVPRIFAALGVLGVASQFTGVTLMMFLGYSPLSFLAMPLAPIHAATAVWLIVKGFSQVPNAPIEVGSS